MTSRASYLPVPQQRLLEDWGRTLRRMFHGEVPYQVGSSTQHGDYRDVDVRIIMNDSDHSDLAAIVAIPRLNVTLSLWGQQVTGLPIDCQVQQMTAANEQYHAQRRNPLGLSHWDTDERLVLG